MSSRTLAQNIAKLSADVANAYTALAAKGATIPASKTTDSLSATIDTVQQGDEPVYGVSSQKQILGNPDGTWTGIEQFGFRGTRTEVPSFDNEYIFAGNPCLTSFHSDAQKQSFANYSNQLKGAFSDCVNLVQADIGLSSGSASFLSGGFNGCTSLKLVRFPNLANNFTGLGTCFRLAPNIERVEFPAAMQWGSAAGSMLSGADKLSAVEFPELRNMAGGMISAFSFCSALTSVDFPKLSAVIGNSSLMCTFSHSGVSSIGFPNLENVGSYSMIAMMGRTGNWSQGAGVRTTRRLTDMENMFPKLKTVNNYGMQYAFANDYPSEEPVKAPKFPELTAVTDHGMQGFLSSATSIAPRQSISGLPEFPKLKQVAQYGMAGMFQCTTLATDDGELVFPELTSVGNYAFDGFASYYYLNGVEPVSCYLTLSFPKLTDIGSYAFNYITYMYTGLDQYQRTSLKFGALTTVNNVIFNGDGVRKYYFPKLTTITGNMFGSSVYPYGKEIHFAAENEAAIRATPNFSTYWGLGSGVATIYFDL